MLTIVRLNWPFYAVTFLILVLCLLGLTYRPDLKWACVLGLAGSLYFLIGSLGVSHLIYDRSDLYRWQWLSRALRGAKQERMIFCHSGFDEASQDLRQRLENVEWLVLDHFQKGQMTEASIRRARRKFPPVADTLAAPFDHWPVASGSADVVFGLLAIHELRSEADRALWFSEAKRCLGVGGRVVLVEHVRDLPNFLAFGPGFLHFHSNASWLRSWERAGFRAIDQFRITPWIRVFVITPV